MRITKTTPTGKSVGAEYYETQASSMVIVGGRYGGPYDLRFKRLEEGA